MGAWFERRMSFRRVMQSSIFREVVTVAWAAAGYGLEWEGNGILSVISVSRGSTNAGGAPRADYAPTIPQQTVIVYQPMFAIITSALIPGVFGEHMKFSGILSASNRSERPGRRPRRGRGVHFRVIGISAS